MWPTPVVTTLRRQRWEDYCKFKANLIYTMSSRSARDTQRDLSQIQRKASVAKWGQQH